MPAIFPHKNNLLHFCWCRIILLHVEGSAVQFYLLDPHDGVIKLRVYGLQVLQRGLLVQHSLVEGQREACVDEFSMVQSLQGRHFFSLKSKKKKKKTHQWAFTKADDVVWLEPLDLAGGILAAAVTYCMAIWFKFADIVARYLCQRATRGKFFFMSFLSARNLLNASQFYRKLES